MSVSRSAVGGTALPVLERRRRFRLTGTSVAPLVFVAPFFLLLIAFTVVPAVYAFYMSLQSDQTGNLVGLNNYNTVLSDPDFQSALKVIWQCVYTLAPFFCIVAAAIALVIDGSAGWGKSAVKLLIFLPFAIPATASTIMWAFNLSPDTSVFSWILHRVGVQNMYAFSTPAALPYAIMNIVVWQNIGAWVVVLTASLAGIPPEIVEMARIEGAGPLDLALRIKLPLVLPILVLMTVSVVSYVLTLITEPFLLAQSLQIPQTYTPNMWAYSTGFTSGAFDLAAAAAMLMLLVSSVFAVTLVLRSGVYRLQDR